MQNKKVDALQFQAAVAEAQAYLTVAFEILAPFLVVLSDDERRYVPRARAGFLEAGRNLALAIAEHPAVAQAAEYDPVAAGECLDNVAQLNGLIIKLGELVQRITDSRLVWLAEALTPVFDTPKSPKKERREVRAEDIEAGIAD